MQKLLAYLPHRIEKKHQAAISVSIVLVYSILFLIWWNTFGMVVSGFVVIPVIVIGWFYGQKTGLTTGLMTIPYITLLHIIMGRQGWDGFLINGLFGSFLTVGAGVFGGWVSEILQTFNEQQSLLEIQILQQIQEQVKRDTSNSRYRSMVEQASDVVYMTDLQGNFEYINPVGVQLTGYSQAELSKMKYLDLIDEKWQERVLFFYKNQARQGLMETSLEFPISTKDGIFLWVEQTTNLLIDNDRLTGFQSILRNITQRKIYQEELAIARDQAESANKVKSRLLAMLSHDIRTPLNAILWYAEMIMTEKMGTISKEQKETLQKIVSSSHQVNSLIHNLLNSTELESGNVTIRIDSFQPERLIKIIMDLLEGAAESKGITLSCRITPDIPKILDGDFQRIQQVLINLVSNAIKFTNQGGVTVLMSLVDKAKWKIEVSDTGPGIAEHTQSEIFKPFHQLNENQPSDQNGIGLGLSIVKEFSELMGGQVGLSSKVGHGSTFWVTLPTKPKLDQIKTLEKSTL